MNILPLIATPISHLFEDRIVGKKIADISDCLEVRERSIDYKWCDRHLFHVDVDLTQHWGNSVKDYLSGVINKIPELKLITFQATRCCIGEKIINGVFQVDGYILSYEEMINNSCENVSWLRVLLGRGVDIGLENNNYYPTPAYETITNGSFITEIVTKNNIKFLFDIAHALVTAHNKNLTYAGYISTLPLDQTVQLHICQPQIPQRGFAVDAHDEPNELMLSEVIRLTGRYSSIRYLTIEYYKDHNNLIESIKTMRKVISDKI